MGILGVPCPAVETLSKCLLDASVKYGVEVGRVTNNWLCTKINSSPLGLIPAMIDHKNYSSLLWPERHGFYFTFYHTLLE